MHSSLHERLKNALAGRSAAELNEFQFLSLDMVKAETGDKWIEIRKKIYGVAAHFVEKRMGVSDVVVRCRGGFILIFADLDAQESRDRLAAISQELNVFFLGDRVLASLEIGSSAQSVDAQQFAEVMQAASRARRGIRSEQGRETPVPSSVASWAELPPISPTGEGIMIPGELDAAERAPGVWKDQPVQGIRNRDARAVHAVNRAAERGAHWPSGEGRSLGMAGMTPFPAGGGAGLDARWQGGQENIPEPARPRRKENAGAVPGPRWDDIIFKPCWDAKLGEITSNLCLARSTHAGKVLYGRDTLRGSDDVHLHRELDRAVAVAAQRAFQKVYAQGEACIVAVPVHYDSIRSVSDRVSYFSILQSVPEHMRRYFFLRVDRIPPGAPIWQMQELFRSMRCFGSHLLAMIPFEQTDLSNFEACRIDIFGSELPARIAVSGPTEADMRIMQQRVKAASAMRAGTFLSQVDSFDVLASAVSAGVKAFSGDAIGPATDLPWPVRPLSFIKICDRAENARLDDDPGLRTAG